MPEVLSRCLKCLWGITSLYDVSAVALLDFRLIVNWSLWPHCDVMTQVVKCMTTVTQVVKLMTLQWSYNPGCEVYDLLVTQVVKFVYSDPSCGALVLPVFVLPVGNCIWGVSKKRRCCVNLYLQFIVFRLLLIDFWLSGRFIHWGIDSLNCLQIVKVSLFLIGQSLYREDRIPSILKMH